MQFAIGVRRNPVPSPRSLSRAQKEVAQLQTLQQGQTQTIQARPGLEVRSLTGILWLTQEGEPTDILLHPGQTWNASRTGSVVVQAMGANANWVMRDTTHIR